MLSVASAISKAATGSTHFFFSQSSLYAAVGGSDCVLMRSNFAALVHALQSLSPHDGEEKCGAEAKHQNTSESLDRAKAFAIVTPEE